MFGKKKKIEEAPKIPLRMAVHNLCKEHWNDEPELAPFLYAVLQFEFNVRNKMNKQFLSATAPPTMDKQIEDLMGKLE